MKTNVILNQWWKKLIKILHTVIMPCTNCNRRGHNMRTCFGSKLLRFITGRELAEKCVSVFKEGGKPVMGPMQSIMAKNNGKFILFQVEDIDHRITNWNIKKNFQVKRRFRQAAITITSDSKEITILMEGRRAVEQMLTWLKDMKKELI